MLLVLAALAVSVIGVLWTIGSHAPARPRAVRRQSHLGLNPKWPPARPVKAASKPASKTTLDSSGSSGSIRPLPGPRAAARRFLAGYLPFTYGQARASRVGAVAPELRARLAAAPPRVPRELRRRRPRVRFLQVDAASSSQVTATAVI